MKKREIVISTRHQATLEFLREQGIDVDSATIIPHISSPEQVRGKIVIGNVPLHIAAFADLVIAITFRNLPPEARGKELTLEEMHEYGAELRVFRVREIPVEWLFGFHKA